MIYHIQSHDLSVKQLFPDAVPVVNGSSGENHGIVIGPFGGVTPALLIIVPEMTAGRISHNSLRKTLPHCEGKVHLQGNVELKLEAARQTSGRYKDLKRRNKESRMVA